MLSENADDEIAELETVEQTVLARELRGGRSTAWNFCESAVKIMSSLQRILTDTATETRKAEDQTTRIDAAIGGHQQRLVFPDDPEAVQRTVADLLNDTGKMRSMAAELSARLQACTEEVNSLTQSLQRAQSEALCDPLTDLRNRRGFEQAASDLHRTSLAASGDSAISRYFNTSGIDALKQLIAQQ